MKKIPVIAVVGPTASGKTSLSIEIAKHFGGQVVSADSMQIYEKMNIATAKPTLEEMQGIPHHLIGFQPISQKFSVAEYVSLANECIEKIHNEGDIPVVAGGTGLYIDSLLQNIQFSKEENNAHIVLSSTWKDLDHEGESCYIMWQYLINSLAKYDMKIMSKTPLIAQKRPLEIKTWLDNRVDKEDIKWISIDDDYGEEDYEEYGIGGHLIHTKFFTYDINDGGLQEKHVELAKQLFENQ